MKTEPEDTNELSFSPPTERTAKDYAIEHAGYLADAVDAYKIARNAHDAVLDHSTDYEVSPDVLQATAEDLTDNWRALESCVHEFRKRAKRAKQSPEPLRSNRWELTDAKINKLQVESIDYLIERCKHAHHTDVVVRINGKDETYQADWIKHLTRLPAVETVEGKELDRPCFYAGCREPRVPPFILCEQHLKHDRQQSETTDSDEREQIIRRAYYAHDGRWPKQLTSGVMFYEGERITREQFMKTGSDK